jgi:hypothetical protein
MADGTMWLLVISTHLLAVTPAKIHMWCYARVLKLSHDL